MKNSTREPNEPDDHSPCAALRGQALCRVPVEGPSLGQESRKQDQNNECPCKQRNASRREGGHRQSLIETSRAAAIAICVVSVVALCSEPRLRDAIATEFDHAIRRTAVPIDGAAVVTFLARVGVAIATEGAAEGQGKAGPVAIGRHRSPPGRVLIHCDETRLRNIVDTKEHGTVQRTPEEASPFRKGIQRDFNGSS